MNIVVISNDLSPHISLFVACFNEEANVFGTLTTVRDACREVGISHEILAVDDGSLDRTAEVVESWVKENPEVPLRLIRNGVNIGLAASYVKAASLAKGEWFRLICGDNVEPRETLVTIFREVGKAEVLLPYFTSTLGKSAHRRQISSLYTFLVNMVSGHRVHYYNGLAVIRRKYALQFANKDLGFGFQADLVTQLLDLGLTFVEIPVTTRERTGGSSTALTRKNFICVSRVLCRVFFRRLRSIFRRPVPVPLEVKTPAGARFSFRERKAHSTFDP